MSSTILYHDIDWSYTFLYIYISQWPYIFLISYLQKEIYRENLDLWYEYSPFLINLAEKEIGISFRNMLE